ncbi:MAG: hypothetical protein ACYCOU_12055, partial [Sulfobacillus sp.]
METPAIAIDIYPFEGGSFTLTPATTPILECNVYKNIRNNEGGTFEIVLAPSGPPPNTPTVGGTPSNPIPGAATLPTYSQSKKLSIVSWTQVITPMSLCIIRMARREAQTVMVGVVQETRENQDWITGQTVTRKIIITGMDFTYFLTREQFYTLAALGLVRSNLQNLPLASSAAINT